jgi:hypothetical protein
VSTSSRRENGAYDGTEIANGQTPAHGVEIEEFTQAKQATDVKDQDQNNVHMLFRHQECHPL